MSASTPSDMDLARHFRENAPAWPGQAVNLTTLELRVGLVTLMYGGGTQAGHPDSVTPFRPASIRGQLRFWWRATKGGDFATWEELARREAEIFGSTNAQSPLRVRVNCDEKPKRVALDEIPRDDALRYGLFPPYNERGANLSERRLQQGGAFRLTISIPNSGLQSDVDAALWAWLNFGGLGARTRRGAGALYCPTYAGWDSRHISSDYRVKDWPVLAGGTLVCGTKAAGWMECWRQILTMYKKFRQDRPVEMGRSGKTRWPEPDEIRALRLGRGAPGPEGFPRGALGMPILFQFKDKVRDPATQALRTDKSERMASPAILKPLAISPTQAVPVLLVLNAPQPRELMLYQGKEAVQVSEGRRDAIAELISRAARELNAQISRI